MPRFGAMRLTLALGLLAVADASNTRTLHPLDILLVGEWDAKNGAADEITASMGRISERTNAGDVFILGGTGAPNAAAFGPKVKEVYSLPSAPAGGLSGADGLKVTREWVCDGDVMLAATCYLDVLLVDTALLTTNAKNTSTSKEEKLTAQRAEQHWAWLECHLRTSTADFLLVAGSSPIYGVGKTGSQPALVDRLLGMLKLHGGHYISGGDNTMALIRDQTTNMFSAGGVKCCGTESTRLPEKAPEQALKYSASGVKNGGFLNLHFTSSKFSISYMDHLGNQLHSDHVNIRNTFGTAYKGFCDYTTVKAIEV